MRFHQKKKIFLYRNIFLKNVNKIYIFFFHINKILFVFNLIYFSLNILLLSFFFKFFTPLKYALIFFKFIFLIFLYSIIFAIVFCFIDIHRINTNNCSFTFKFIAPKSMLISRLIYSANIYRIRFVSPSSFWYYNSFCFFFFFVNSSSILF